MQVKTGILFEKNPGFDLQDGGNFVILQSVMTYGFDNDKYLKIQSEHIRERIAQFGNKLYLELEGNYSMTIMQAACCRDSSPTASFGCFSN